MRGALGALTAAAAALSLAFLVVPLVAIFLEVSPAALLEHATGDVAVDALLVTLKTNGIAVVLMLGLGTPTAWQLATRRFRGRSVVLTLVELPLVLPPAVAGIGLLAAFGRFGLLGEPLGLGVAFTQAAVVLAVLFVAGPFYLRPAVAAFEAVDPNLLAAARTLGAGPVRTFFRVALPLATPGLAAAAALGIARGLGEFGATIMFAGSLQGVTQTLSLAIYQAFDVEFDVALAIGAELILVSAALLLAVKVVPSWRSGSSSTILSAPFGSR